LKAAYVRFRFLIVKEGGFLRSITVGVVSELGFGDQLAAGVVR